MLILKISIIAAVLFLVWAGTCVYSNFIAKPDTGLPDIPDLKEAAYSVHIENTGGLILTNDFEQHGQDVGSRIYVLHGYWEMQGQDFKYKQGEVILSEVVFGEITIKRRQNK